MLLPVVYAVARANPQHEFTLLTQPFLTGLLLNPPSNLEAMAIDIRHEERSLGGLLRYIERLRAERFDYFVDLHDVLRTRIIRWSLFYSRTRVRHLRKPRRARRALLHSSRERGITPLTHMSELYRKALRSAGLIVPVETTPLELNLHQASDAIKEFPEILTDSPRVIGIAPFASTESKTYDLQLMEQCVALLSARGDIQIYLFGGRGKEAEQLSQWVAHYPHVRSVAGRLELTDELVIISRLSAMITMDSANMHFASLVGTPAISVWCATHPSAGFLGLNQILDDCIQDSSMACRPCSIFGRVKRCIHGDMPCRRSISPEQITHAVLKYI